MIVMSSAFQTSTPLPHCISQPMFCLAGELNELWKNRSWNNEGEKRKPPAETARTNKAGTCFLNQPYKNQILSPHLLPQGSLSAKA